ncbi:MAG: hypothetical protein H6907_04285 [Hyphomicrobiales bacterium]|nr:hypothetical protein [Hyphomicrobiales bacterium]
MAPPPAPAPEPGRLAPEMMAAQRGAAHATLRLDGGAAVLSWDVRAVAHGALDAAVARLMARPPMARYFLHFFLAGWAREEVTSAGRLARRVAELSAFRGVPMATRHHVVDRDLADMAAESPKLARLFEVWERAGRHPGTEAMAELAPEALICTRKDGGREYLPTYIGGRQYLRHLMGNPFCSALLWRGPGILREDSAHASRVYGAYERTLVEGPLYQHVLTLVDPAEGEPVWARYRRLVVPWRPRAAPPGVLAFGDAADDPDTPFNAVPFPPPRSTPASPAPDRQQ